MDDAKAMQRAKSRTSPDFCRAQKGKYSTMVVVFLIPAVLIPTRVVTATPAPSPTVSVQQNIRLPLWQSSLSMNSLNGLPLWQNAASAASLGMNSGISKKKTPLHHFDLSCSNCHDPANATEDRKMRGGTIWRMSVDINRACSSLGCHDYNPVLNHPVGVSASPAAPDHLPLDDSARITCLTCHSESETSVASATDGDDNERVLRIPDGANLCGSCHLQSGVLGKNQLHWQFSTRAHLGRMNPKSNTSANPVRFFGDIDSESYACLACHADVTATIPGYNETPAEKAIRRSRMKDHPIGMNYNSSSMARAGRLRSLEHADSAIRLFDGKVGCGSCHSLYSDIKGYLAKENHRSSLCFQCHAR